MDKTNLILIESNAVNPRRLHVNCVHIGRIRNTNEEMQLKEEEMVRSSLQSSVPKVNT